MTRRIRPATRALDMQTDTVSAARRAAEAAFTAPPRTPPAAEVPVRVVSARRRLQPSVELQSAPAAAATEQPAVKTPRVFLLGDAQGQRPLPLSPAETPPVGPALRRRAVNTTKRPGPVLWQLADVARSPVAAAAEAQAGHASPLEQLDGLRGMLDDLEPTFAQIRFAQSFQIELPSES